MRGVGWLGRNQWHLQAQGRVSEEGVEGEGRGGDVLGEALGPGPPLQPGPGSKTEDAARELKSREGNRRPSF